MEMLQTAASGSGFPLQPVDFKEKDMKSLPCTCAVSLVLIASCGSFDRTQKKKKDQTTSPPSQTETIDEPEIGGEVTEEYDRLLFLSDLDEAKAVWDKLGLSTYAYEIDHSSWIGTGNQTTISVVDSLVTKRSYREYEVDQTSGRQQTTFSYEEAGTILGSNEKGAQPLTVEQIMDECRNHIFEKWNESYSKMSIRFDDNGVFSCFYRPLNCEDDCTEGLGFKLK